MSAARVDAGLLERLRAAGGAPDAIALEDGALRVSYGALWDGVLRAAARLDARLGARREPIAIVAANGVDYVLAMLGALASGRPVAEISPHEPLERLLPLLGRLAPGLVVTSLDPAPIAAAGHAVVAASEFAPGALATQAPRAAPAPATAADLAFIVFTSGTTGQPKGVMLSHGNVTAVVDAILDYLPLRPSDRYALVLPLFHTYAKSVLLTTLAAGGTVVLDSFNDLPGFVARLDSQRITAFSGVPYHVAMLLRRAPLDRHDLSRLRYFTISGSHLATDALLELARRFPDARVVFMYGMTETSTRACALPPERIGDKPGSCGRPIRGVALRIVGEDGRDLPPGAKGEVLVRGPNVMQGYYGDAALTQATLRDGWLHTGDLGYLDEEGFLFLVGRRTDLIKCAGERLSAREIEEVLVSHPGVLEAAVAGEPHPVLGEAVHAWIVRRAEELTEDELRRHCAQHLTHHAIPRSWSFVGELPRTASGKVQKHRLPGRSA
ncbi:MAG: acyl--CoA ligase [Acidobacteria bacterium]|nr:acyl--CoA ligase [Acidobacteriota bacterium]